MKVTGRVEVIIDDQEAQRIAVITIFKMIHNLLGNNDDAGMDWVTDYNGHTYVGSKDWLVSSDHRVAILVNAANLIIYGEILNVYEEEKKDAIHNKGEMK